MVNLSVNLNKIALLRNSRGGTAPDLLEAACTVTNAGCQGITVHPRPDGRHIKRRDVLDLAQMLTVEFNIEGYPIPEFVDLVLQVRPTQCTLVPDPPDALTSNAGWDLASCKHDWLREILLRLRDHGIRTSLFLEADVSQVPRARALGADRIELFTGPYAHAFGTTEGNRMFKRIAGPHALRVKKV